MKFYTPALLAAIALLPLIAAEPAQIVIRMTPGKTFEPKNVTIKAGQTVQWKNLSDMTHSVTDMSSLAVTAQDAGLPPHAKEFNSGFIAPGKDYSYTFTIPGTYKYFCIPHEEAGMVGTIVVTK